MANRNAPRQRCIAAAFALALLAIPHPAAAQGQGITEPTVFPPFDAAAAACRAPPGLTRTLVFAQDNERQFMQGVGHGLAMAAADRGLEFRTTLADNDPARREAYLRMYGNICYDTRERYVNFPWSSEN